MTSYDSITIYNNGDDFIPTFSKDTMVIAGNSGSRQFPLAYIRRPKGISKEDWAVLKEKIQITVLK